jgi:lipopolysaccharide transport system permease protein
VASSVRDAYAAREVLVFLAWRDIKVRYKQTAIGIAWALLQPLLSTLLLTVVFNHFVGISSPDVPYPVFVLAGLLPWAFFSNTLPASTSSLILNAPLLTKLYIPRMLIPTAAVGVALLDLAISLALLVVIMLWYGVRPGLSLALFPVVLANLTILTLGLGLGLAAITVRFRDVRYVVPFFLQILLFVSPVIYPPTVIPANLRWLLDLNPLTGIVDGFRAVLLNAPIDSGAITASLGVSLLILIAAAKIFCRLERSFADEV